MKVSKAIEILTIELGAFPHKGTEDWYASVQLGIEALKQIDQLHVNNVLGDYELLPGETPEEEVEDDQRKR